MDYDPETLGRSRGHVMELGLSPSPHEAIHPAQQRDFLSVLGVTLAKPWELCLLVVHNSETLGRPPGRYWRYSRTRGTGGPSLPPTQTLANGHVD